MLYRTLGVKKGVLRAFHTPMGKRAAVPSRAVPSSARDCIYLLVKCSHVQLKEIIISMFLYRFPFGDRAALRNHKFGIKEEERQGGKCREH